MEQSYACKKRPIVGDLNDNILPFKQKKADDGEEMTVTVSLEEEGISNAFETFRIAAIGLMNDKYCPTEASDIVHGAIILISWMAKESGVSATELLEFFRSIELEDFED